MAVLIQAGGTNVDLHDAFYHRQRWVVADPVALDFPKIWLPDGHAIALPSITTDSGYGAQVSGGLVVGLLGDDIVVSRETGRLSSGTVTAVAMIDSSADTRFALYDTAISAAQIMQVALTDSTADDRALFAARLAGDDVITGHPTQTLAETLAGHGGADLLIGFAGADRLDGGTGADMLLGGAGRDTLLGGAGNDLLAGDMGGASANSGDALRGGDGNDVLIADGDRLGLTGGAGADTFAFVRGSTGSTITDFRPGADHILLDGWTAGFGALRLTRIDGDDTLVTAGSITLRLSDVLPRELDAGDFILGRSLDSFVDQRVSGWLNGWDYAT